jgi:hypothetical protein
MRHAATLRRQALLWAMAVGLSALGVLQIVGRSVDANSVRAMRAAGVTQGIEGSMASLSADGSLVAYVAPPEGAASPESGSSVWILDRRAAVTTDLTSETTDVAQGESAWPTVSGDGCSMTFITQLALDGFRDDNTGVRFDVYQKRLARCGGEAGDWELVSVAADGASATSGLDATAGDDVDPAHPPVVSADGTFVAYQRAGAEQSSTSGVVLVDLTVPSGQAGRIEFIAGAIQPALSADGSTLAYVRDGAVVVTKLGLAAEGTTERPVQVAAARGSDPSLSADGNTIAFVSDDVSLVPNAVLPSCEVRCVQQVYVSDLLAGSVTLASRVPGDPLAAPVGADADALQPTLGASGGELLFITRATNLFPSRNAAFGAPDEGDVVLAAPSAATAVRLSTSADGVTPTPATNTRPSLSATGRVVVFDHRDTATGGRSVAVLDLVPRLAMSDLDVGTAAVGENGPEWFVQVENQGPSSFVPHAVSVDNANFVITGGSCRELADVPMPPGASCSVLVRMSPASAGLHTARITVSESGEGAYGGSVLTVSAQIRGVGGLPAIETLPGGGDAGVVQVGTVSERLEFDVINVGRELVRIASVAVQGPQALDFVVVGDGCTGDSVRTAGRCTVGVAFAPGVVGGTGRRTASVVVRTEGGETYASFLVSGTAYYSPTLTSSADPVATGSRVVIGGSGFSPRTAVTLGWADGWGAVNTVFTDDAGSWSLVLVVRATDRVGTRTLVAQTLDGQVASLPVRVVSTTQSPRPR